jgi:hypothetical protein
MTLSRDQTKHLSYLTEYLRKMEKQKTEDNIDLDVFMTDYSGGDISIYATEKIELDRKARNRKKIYEKTVKEKIQSGTKEK